MKLWQVSLGLAGNGPGGRGTPRAGRKLALPDAFRQDHHHGSGPARLNLGTWIGGAKNPTHYLKAASRACRSEQIVGAQELIQVYLGATRWLLNFFSRASRAGRALFSRLEWRQPQLEYRLLVPVAEQDHRNPTGHGSAQANQTQTPLVYIRAKTLRLVGDR